MESGNMEDSMEKASILQRLANTEKDFGRMEKERNGTTNELLT